MPGAAAATALALATRALLEQNLRRGQLPPASLLEVTMHRLSIKALKILDGEDRYGLIIESEEDYDEDQVEERNVVEDEESDEDWDNDHLDNDGEEQPEAFQDELNLAEDTEAPKAAKPPKPKHSRPGRPRKNAHPKT